MATSAISVGSCMEALQSEVSSLNSVHLRDLLQDVSRCESLRVEYSGMIFDYSRQKLTLDIRQKLIDLANSAQVLKKLKDMQNGVKLNTTEDRAVLHTALRASPDESVIVDGVDVIPLVHEVRNKIDKFAEAVRNGSFVGSTGKKLCDVVAIGIGGSYLGPEFVYEALRFEPQSKESSKGRRLRFLANVDPVDVSRATEGLNPETTLVIVVSKTFTTAETMLNARTMRKWIVDAMGTSAVKNHMVAVSTNLKAVSEFGIDPENAFGFWDWVGGRYSVCSAVGLLPLTLQYGSAVVSQFMNGAQDIDRHSVTAPIESNIPVLMGLVGVWNSTFLKYGTRALLPYQQALLKLAPHIQQVDMESNGKRVCLDGSEMLHESGPVNFGEPGTNGQHSFYQLMHQGRVVPADFVGVIHSQTPVELEGETVSNHDELMSNFFAQPDALACGKTAQELRAEGVPELLVPHKVFSGNRPSSILLMKDLSPFSIGQLLAIFEHRTAVEGFIWNINSFDQWGVELGKVLAKQVRTQLQSSRNSSNSAPIEGFNPSTTFLLQHYLRG
mmetsp:Transcript_807/g.1508  ORF Transcript_807/g.1508 Transcript_807/m.1508 type:complete len:555 (-) Transcript_807:169-1833(-)|eukprot:CAMPEP_0182450874 /NCGR_PEP_ID=MMETSP1172-20130603/43413_1 /TAXON_ID=708627 /ORGANISM="Timspurckia oligopyrenoides, Strain CCMP3278" /LENGTH=554 /DNA_ID=CAMNT_0024648597 /DNA_START=37 /DNA_END=1701 /DNA_ORIENTATION=+